MTEPRTTPMMQQYQALKGAYPDCILLFRMGDFYELFGADALLAAPIMGVALTSRDKGKEDAEPMCGFPHHAASSYIARLIRAGQRVAVAEQMEDPRLAKGIVKREVIRVVTPGTVLDEKLLDARENSYLLALAPGPEGIGLAAVDLTTAEFRATEIQGEDAAERARGEVERYSPREILVPASMEQELSGRLGLSERILRSTGPDWTFQPEQAADLLKEQLGVATLEGFGLEGLPQAVGAAGALLVYVRDTQMQAPDHLRSLSVYRTEEHMVLDDSTRRNLELTRTLIAGDREGTLLDLLDRTGTAMGARLLKRWLLRPLLELVPIEERLDGVERLARNHEERRLLRGELRRVYDLERLLGRISLGAASPRDLAALRGSLHRVPGVLELLGGLKSALLDRLMEGSDPLEDLRELLDRSLVDSPPATLREGNLIRDGHSPDLDELRTLARQGRGMIAQVEAQEREATGIGSLKIRFNRVFGYFIEVSKAKIGQVPDRYVRKQTLVNAERFYTPELKELESKVLGAEERMTVLEQELFQQLREQLAGQARRIQRLAELLACADVLSSLAEVAVQYDYVRPVISEGEELEIRDGRHPVVERIAEGEAFVPNDTLLDRSSSQIHLITGPNMAGKSTYIRQVALITLMGQIGSFVPAREARIGLTDRIFTRVGASDNLYGGLSTFMVEMTETAHILNCATPRSLIILDEIGRGTSTYDGLAIAWSVVEHLHDQPAVAARTLFATHYHELTDLADVLERLENHTVQVREWNDEVIFLRKVAPGSADRSYGIQVGRLAGLPAEVVDRAKEVLANLEQAERDSTGRPALARRRIQPEPVNPGQLNLFRPAPVPSRLVRLLREIDIHNITPLEGLNHLSRLLTELESEERG